MDNEELGAVNAKLDGVSLAEPAASELATGLPASGFIGPIGPCWLVGFMGLGFWVYIPDRIGSPYNWNPFMNHGPRFWGV